MQGVTVTVALMAHRHHQMRRTTALATGLAGLVVAAGLSIAASVQSSLADDVVRAIGATEAAVEIVVDGRDVTIRGSISSAQRAAVAGLESLGRLTIVEAP